MCRFLSWPSARGELARRLAEPASGRIVLVTGPPASGKTSVLRTATQGFGDRVVLLSAAAHHSPRQAIDAASRRAVALAAEGTPALLAIDDVHLARGWETRLDGLWRRVRAGRLPLRIALAGCVPAPRTPVEPPLPESRYERLRLRPWDAATLVESALSNRDDAAARAVAGRAHPMAWALTDAEWSRVVDGRLVSPALARDLPAVAGIRRPGVLRGVLDACVHAATRSVTLAELTAAVGGRVSVETVSRHLLLLEAAGLIAAIPQHAAGSGRIRHEAFRIVLLDNALFWAGVGGRGRDRVHPGEAGVVGEGRCRDAGPASFDVLVRNACLAHAWHSGQRLAWWREGGHEVDALLDGDWGRWIVRVRPGPVESADIDGLIACCERHPEYEPVLVGEEAGRAVADDADIEWTDWRDWVTRPSWT